MSYHTISPKLLSDGTVEIMITEAATGHARYVRLSNADAVILAGAINSLAKAGRKL